MSTTTDPRSPATWRCHAGDVAFTLSAPRRWLAEQRRYLSGFLTAPQGESSLRTFDISIHTTDAEFQHIAEPIACSPQSREIEPVPGLTMRELCTRDGLRRYSIAKDHVEDQPGAYAVTARGDQIELFVHSHTVRPHRYPIRLLREAMVRTHEDAGGVIIHAAGVDVDGSAVMVCGPRGAGKTTITATLLHATPAALLSNDRVVLHHTDRVVAVPLPVPIARGTIDSFPELQDLLRREASPCAAWRSLPAEFGSAVKYPFTARQFARAFRTDLASSSTVRMIVVPHLSDTTEPAHLRPLTPAETHRALAASCFTPRDEFWIRPWVVPRRQPETWLAHHADTIIRDVAATMPGVEVRFGVRNPLPDLVDVLTRAVDDLP